MKKLKTKSSKEAITLVSLVITIIVLLILAGITISLTIGEGGIIKRAQEAGKNYTEAAENEKLQMGQFTNEINNIINNTSNNRNSYTSDFRKNVIKAINSAGIETSENATDQTIIDNIEKISQQNNNIELLWKNELTSTTFVAQTISLDLSNYDAIIISFIGKSTWNSKWYFTIPIGTSQAVNMYMDGDATNVGASVWYRIVTPTLDGVSIGNALNNETCNDGVIPCEIYGIKNFI